MQHPRERAQLICKPHPFHQKSGVLTKRRDRRPRDRQSTNGPVRQAEKKSPLPLKPPRRTHDCHGLIHHPLPHAEILVDPLLEVFVLGNLAGFKAGAVKDPTRPTGPRQGEIISLFSFFLNFCFLMFDIDVHGRGWGWGWAYVRPVDRLTPARKAETVQKLARHSP